MNTTVRKDKRFHIHGMASTVWRTASMTSRLRRRILRRAHTVAFRLCKRCVDISLRSLIEGRPLLRGGEGGGSNEFSLNNLPITAVWRVLGPKYHQRGPLEHTFFGPFRRLILGCIEATFCKQIVLTRSTLFPLHHSRFL